MQVAGRPRLFPADTRSTTTAIRGVACIAALSLLSACASHAPVVKLTATQEAATYVARAKPSYAPPGPPEDPWGPYVVEAAQRFDVPDRWIRQVMRIESGGYQYRASGVLTTSPVGAMGLMQLMPETYDEVRARYNLGDDAYDPHNNILAGAAYIREMYDAFGSPGFLAAYNGGPARLQDYLVHNRPLPDETRRYVAMIAPNIQGFWPQSRSPAEQFAVNQLPILIPAGPRYARHVAVAARGRRAHEPAVRVASTRTRNGAHAASSPVEVAEAPEVPRGWHSAHAPVAGPVRLASAVAPARHAGLHLIAPAMASESAGHAVGGSAWAIQVGAYGRAGQAEAAAGAARNAAGAAHAVVAPIQSGHATLYRARLSGMTHDAAIRACQKLAHSSGHCIIVAPAAS
jgi:hypothetical protein